MNSIMLVVESRNDVPRRFSACANEEAAGREMARLAGEILGLRTASASEAKAAFDLAYSADCDELAKTVELLCPEYGDTVYVVWQCTGGVLTTLEVFADKLRAQRLHLRLANRTYSTKTCNPTRARKICESRSRSGSLRAPGIVELTVLR